MAKEIFQGTEISLIWLLMLNHIMSQVFFTAFSAFDCVCVHGVNPPINTDNMK